MPALRVQIPQVPAEATKTAADLLDDELPRFRDRPLPIMGRVYDGIKKALSKEKLPRRSPARRGLRLLKKFQKKFKDETVKTRTFLKEYCGCEVRHIHVERAQEQTDMLREKLRVMFN